MNPVNNPCITNADEAKLVDLINRAERRILYLAPGVSERIADALTQRWQQLGPNTLTVILDVDPEVCRLGFGTVEGLFKIRQAASQANSMVCHQPGVRIGLMICDDTTLIFSPTPLLIEAGSNNPHRPNAIQLDAPPPEVTRDTGLGEKPNIERVIGLDPIKPDQIDEVANDLKSAPPVKFDLARRVRVFTTRFQFVELEMTGCYISRKRVPIPSSLVGLARNEDIASQFHAHFNLVQQGQIEVKTDNNKIVSERSLLKKRKSIEKSFLINLKGYGMVLLRANKERFMNAVKELENEVSAYAQGVEEGLQKQIKTSKNKLAEALFPSVKQNPPDSYTKIHGPVVPENYLKQRLEEDISDAFGTAKELIKNMQVKVVFKDVAYESLVDSDFLEIARQAMPGVSFLHDEFDTVPTNDDNGV